MKKLIYYIVRHTWDATREDFNFIVHYQSSDAVKIREMFDSLEPDIDTPLIEMYLRGDDEDTRIAYKDIGGEFTE